MSGAGCAESKNSDADEELPVEAVSEAVATEQARAIAIAQSAVNGFLGNMY